MDIDGFDPADPKIANETGVPFKYPSTFENKNREETTVHFSFVAKSSGHENTGFQVRAEEIKQLRLFAEAEGQETTVMEKLRVTLALWYDHVIVDWSTSITSGGKPVTPSRNNFIEIFAREDQLFIDVFNRLSNDCGRISNFAKKNEAEAVKNSQNTSTGK